MNSVDDRVEILVMGAGSVGGYFGAMLKKRTAAEVTFVARGTHLQAMQQKGLTIKSSNNAIKLSVRATDEPGQAPPPDLILFTVKSYDTPSAIEQIKPIVSEHTQILTLQNGIENYPKLVQAFGEKRVIQGFCKVGASLPEPGVISHAAFGEVTMGEPGGHQSERLKKIASLFKQAGIPTTVSGDIRHEVWLKFTWNCLLNMVTAAADVTVDQIFKIPEGPRFCYRLFDELQEVAEKEGVDISDEEGATIIESARSLKGFETSTYQDRQKGKPMEYEAFTGAILRLADRHGLDLPHHQSLYAILKMVDLNANGR